jgi:hypothetical protein
MRAATACELLASKRSSIPASQRRRYVSNFFGFSISQADVGDGGTLTPQSPPPVPAWSLPRELSVSPDAGSVHVSNLGSEDVSQYDIGPQRSARTEESAGLPGAAETMSWRRSESVGRAAPRDGGNARRSLRTISKLATRRAAKRSASAKSRSRRWTTLPARHLQAERVGQPQVEQQQVGLLVVAEPERVGGRRRGQGAVAIRLEVVAEQLQCRRVVLAHHYGGNRLGVRQRQPRPSGRRAGSSSTESARGSRKIRLGGAEPRTEIGARRSSRKIRCSGNRMPKVWTLRQRGISRPSPARLALRRASPRRRERAVAATGTDRPASSARWRPRNRNG